MNVWKDYTTEDATTVIEKAAKPSKPETIKSSWRKLCPNVTGTFTRFTKEPIKETMKEIVDMKKKKWGIKSFKIGILEKFKNKWTPHQKHQKADLTETIQWRYMFPNQCQIMRSKM